MSQKFSNLRKTKNKIYGKVYYSFIISYLVFGLVLLTINFTFSSILKKNLIAEFNKSYQYTLTEFSDKFQQLTYDLSFSIATMLKNKNEYNLSSSIPMGKIDTHVSTSIENIKMSKSENVNTLGIYFPDYDYIVSNMGLQTTKYYFTACYGINDTLRSYCLEQLKDTSVSYFIFDYGTDQHLCYAYHTNINGLSAVYFSSVSLYNCYKEMQNIRASTNASIILYNKSSDIILANEDCVSSFREYLTNGNNHYYVLENSLSPGWTSYLLNEDAFYTKPIKSIKIMTYLTIIVYLIFLFLTTLYFSKKHYAPIKKLTYLFKKNMGEAIGINEFNFLEQNIDNLIHSNSTYARESERRKNLNELKRIVLGNVSDSSNTQTLFSDEEKQGAFSVAIFKICDSSLKKLKDSNYTTDDIDTIFSNISEEILEAHYNSWVFPIDGNYCCLINSAIIDRNTLEIAFSQVMKLIGFYFDIDFMISVSSIENGCETIPTLYKNASELMSLIESIGNVRIKFYDDIKSRISSKNFNMNIKTKLLFLIKKGKASEASELINATIDDAINNISTIDMLEKTVFEVLTLLNYTLNSLFEGDNSPMPEKYAPINQIFPYKNINELKINIYNYLTSLSEYLNLENSNIPLEQKIVNYIKENYGDPNLDGAMICSKFNIHNTYLSRIFNERLNTGMHEYITAVRINKAKELLMNTDEKIEDISMKVGYTNIRSFSRAFKRITDISPSQFRTHCKLS